MPLEKTIGQPCAGNPHARLDRGSQVVGRLLTYLTLIT